ncbi:hypothetical protein GCM10009675_32430 [Prauserella alba]|uniref:Uncharacterized protein n=1 Tax=Prauserella alba TaxID=176898 RepID=A0ABN1VHI4_9PSEU
MLFEPQRKGGLHAQHHDRLATLPDGEVHRLLGLGVDLFEDGQRVVETEPTLRGLPEQDRAGAEVVAVGAEVVGDQPARAKRPHHPVRRSGGELELRGDP